MKEGWGAVERRVEEGGVRGKMGRKEVGGMGMKVWGREEEMKGIEEEGGLEEWWGENVK